MDLLPTQDPSRNHACYYAERTPPEPIVGSMERVKSMLVGTVFDRPLRTARWALSLCRLWQHPELHAYRCEERIVDQLIERLVQPGWNCIDVGSHLGSSLAEFIRLAPQGHHLAFEPVPQKAERLRRKFRSVGVHELALVGDSDRLAFFHHGAQTALSGFREGPSDEPGFVPLNVKRARLDDVVPVDLRIDLIKVDVEGGELGVLQGSRRTLERWRPHVLFECTEAGNRATGVTGAEVFRWIDSVGYEIFMPGEYLSERRRLSAERFTAALEYPFQAINFLALPR